MAIENITDPSDPRIAVYRNLKDKDLRRDHAFIVEGKFILDTLLTRSRFGMTSVLLSEDRLGPLDSLLKQVPDAVPIYVTTSKVMAEIAGYHVHRGILAAGHAADVQKHAFLADFQRVAVLSNISNPDNIGSIFRNAAGLGVEAILLDMQCCSPLYRKAIRVSMGATLVLPWFQSGSIKEIIQNLISSGFTAYALSLQNAEKLENVLFEQRCAFLFGEEAYGLDVSIQALCRVVTIPMSNGTDSLNVAATSAIVFETARRQRG